jgi:CRP/FNR family cyclic AMP-dependent transcriptional regulator
MAKEKKIKVKYEEIRSSPLFTGVPDKLVKKIATYFNGKNYNTGDNIIKENDIGDFMFIVLSGQVDILKGPKSIKLATLGPGIFIGEGALVSGAPRNATVVAATPVKLAVIYKDVYDKMVTIHSAISITLIKTHKERCKDTLKKVNIAKSKAFLITAAVAVIPAIQSFAPSIPHMTELLAHLPPAIMALIGPGAIAFALKLQQGDMGDLVTKLDKL